jgi:hypothetical protein
MQLHWSIFPRKSGRRATARTSVRWRCVRRSLAKITAREIAEDIAREINSDSGEGSFHGVFVAAGPEPTESELADARRRLDEFQRRLVAAADLEWERTKNPMFITDLERRAARQLGLEKPWLYDPKPLAECPVCAEKIKHGVAVCRSCGAILDREKAAQYGLVPQARPRRNASAIQDGAGKPEQEAAKEPLAEAKQ